MALSKALLSKYSNANNVFHYKPSKALGCMHSEKKNYKMFPHYVVTLYNIFFVHFKQKHALAHTFSYTECNDNRYWIGWITNFIAFGSIDSWQ